MRLALYILLFFILGSINAQIDHPKASPLATVEQSVGLSTIKVVYSRPAVKGRTIFGDLLPYGRIWRVGANESTKITTDTDMEVMGNYLPKGTYALYAFPHEKEWEIVFHKNTTHWGDGRKAYNPQEDAFRITVVPEKTADFQENFLISFDALTHNSVQMQWIWAHTKVSISMWVDTKAQMLRQIREALQNKPTAQTYYEAARYLQEEGQSYQEALSYLEKAIALAGDTYYFHRVKSLVEAAMQHYEKAINSAEKSLLLAQKEEKDEFVRMNKKNIEYWKELIKRQKK
ncbi:DUF2911 domain-containing protein [Spongiimicrobium salis]|uniref:DUF2911 domain-containing protein n=1 Tax=Spongiimicrobium salis TaxID=1667022 RepID=UPI00374CE0CE